MATCIANETRNPNQRKAPKKRIHRTPTRKAPPTGFNAVEADIAVIPEKYTATPRVASASPYMPRIEYKELALATKAQMLIKRETGFRVSRPA